MKQELMNEIDNGCLPTINKYVKDQLIGAIFNYIEKEDTSGFSDKNFRNIIKNIGVNNFKRALLEHIIKLDAAFDIKKSKGLFEFSKNYRNHTVDETELRMLETLFLSIDDVFNKTAIQDAINILNKDGIALYNVIKSFVEYRYVKAKIKELDTLYVKSESHKHVMWKIDDYFKTIDNKK